MPAPILSVSMRSALVLSLAAVSCARDMGTAPSALPVASASSPTSVLLSPTSISCPECVFGPQTYTRANGKPQTETTEFAGNPAASYIIDIDDGGSQGANATVTLNGVALFGPGTSDVGGHLRRAVTLLATNTIEVQLRGKPGSTLTVFILRETSDVSAAAVVTGGTATTPATCSPCKVGPARRQRSR